MEKSSFKKWCSTCKKIILDRDLILFTKINSKWITDLNVRPKSLKLLEERQSSRHRSRWWCFESNTKSKSNKNRNNWDYIILFCTEKETNNKVKRPPTECEKRSANPVFDKRLTHKIYIYTRYIYMFVSKHFVWPA